MVWDPGQVSLRARWVCVCCLSSRQTRGSEEGFAVWLSSVEGLSFSLMHTYMNGGKMLSWMKNMSKMPSALDHGLTGSTVNRKVLSPLNPNWTPHKARCQPGSACAGWILLRDLQFAALWKNLHLFSPVESLQTAYFQHVSEWQTYNKVSSRNATCFTPKYGMRKLYVERNSLLSLNETKDDLKKK